MRNLLILSAGLGLTATPVLAEDSVGHVSAAAGASAMAVENLAQAGVQAVAGVVALPLGVAGGASQAVGGIAQAGGDSLVTSGRGAEKAAGQILDDSWGPLKVGDKVVVRADPAPKVPYAAQKSAGR